MDAQLDVGTQCRQGGDEATKLQAVAIPLFVIDQQPLAWQGGLAIPGRGDARRTATVDGGEAPAPFVLRPALLPAAEAEPADGERELGRLVVGIQADGLPVILFGLGEAILLGAEDSAIEIAIGVIGGQPDGLLVVVQGEFVLAVGGMEYAAMAPGLSCNSSRQSPRL